MSIKYKIMRALPVVLAIFFIMPFIQINESCNISKNGLNSIPWGEMQATIAKSMVEMKKYDWKIVQMNISYKPYFFQYFPIIGEVSLAYAPPWLLVIPSIREFILFPGEIKIVNITLMVREDVENGTVDTVEFIIFGRTIAFSTFLEILPAHPSLIVRIT